MRSQDHRSRCPDPRHLTDRAEEGFVPEPPPRYEPTFLRGPFLERWRAASRQLRPPMTESWAGPWQALRVPGQPPGEPLPWGLYRVWEEPGATPAAGRFHSYELAALLAELLPFRQFPSSYAIDRQRSEEGYAVCLEGQPQGYLEGDGPRQLRRLEMALRVVEFLADSPEVLGAVLAVAGYQAVVEALEGVAGRLSR